MTTANEIMEKAVKQAAGGQNAAGIGAAEAGPADAGAVHPVFPRSQLGQGTQVGSVRLTEEQLRARRARSIAIAIALGAFVLLIFSVTIVKLGSNVFTGPSYMRPAQAH